MLLNIIKQCHRSFDTSKLTAKSNFVALKAKIDKLGIAKLANVPTSLDNLKKSRRSICWSVKNCSRRLRKTKWCSR